MSGTSPHENDIRSSQIQFLSLRLVKAGNNFSIYFVAILKYSPS